MEISSMEFATVLLLEKEGLKLGIVRNPASYQFDFSFWPKVFYPVGDLKSVMSVHANLPTNGATSMPSNKKNRRHVFAGDAEVCPDPMHV